MWYSLVKNNVVVLDEHVAKNSKAQASVAKGRQASTVGVGLEDKVRGGDLEFGAGNSEGEVAERRDIASDLIRAVTIVGGLVLGRYLLGNAVGEEEESGPGVKDGREAAGLLARASGQARNGDAPETYSMDLIISSV